ncbi:MAG: dihydroorotate dehydrogenase electron transfer subunit [Clostridia bacterium]|jgi:dihydroorotate dehydrogenase electron transfer subunit
MAIYRLTETKQLTYNVFRSVFKGDTDAIKAPGQFMDIQLDGLFLRRPISVCDVSDDSITLIYKTVGKGTDMLSRLPEGSDVDMLSGLGNGFDINKGLKRPLLIGGGVGVPPLYYLAKKLREKGYGPLVILGFNSAADVFYEEEFKKTGCITYVTSCDGSYGIKGFVTDAMNGISYDYIYACGPEQMLKAVYYRAICDGQYSFEERMGCGFGACMGCTCKTKYGYKRICKDGPVLETKEIIW